MRTHRASQGRLARLLADHGSGPWSLGDLLALGWTEDQVYRAAARGALTRLRRGVYRAGDREPGGAALVALDSWPEYLAVVMRSLPSSAVLTHDTAARLFGLWNPRPGDPTIHVVVPGQSGRGDAGVRVRASPLPDRFITELAGWRVTTLARTAVDVARGTTLPDAVMVFDSALRLILARDDPGMGWRLRERRMPERVLAAARDELAEAIESVRGWPGSAVLHPAFECADPLSESPFESWSRAWLWKFGVAEPQLNLEVFGASGRRYFGDFVWVAERVIGEADGVGKYGSTGASLRRAVRAERERHADLEAAGWRVVRWITGERGLDIVHRVNRALWGAPGPTQPRASSLW